MELPPQTYPKHAPSTIDAAVGASPWHEAAQDRDLWNKLEPTFVDCVVRRKATETAAPLPGRLLVPAEVWRDVLERLLDAVHVTRKPSLELVDGCFVQRKCKQGAVRGLDVV